MANTTRLKMANQATPYIRVGEEKDFAQHDSAHTASQATGLGSSADFALHDDSNTKWASDNHVISGSSATLPTSGDELLILQIKHTGYQDAAKTTATADGTVIHILQDGSDTTRYMSIYPNESIILHAPFGTNSDNANDWAVLSSSGAIYAEVITCRKTND